MYIKGKNWLDIFIVCYIYMYLYLLRDLYEMFDVCKFVFFFKIKGKLNLKCVDFKYMILYFFL